MLEVASQVATIVGVLGLLFAWYSLRQSRDTFHQGVIVSCTNRFQQLSARLRLDSLSGEVVQQYLELCNEELFYFEKQYLPQAIIDEWVEGMLSVIGLWDNEKLVFLPRLAASNPQDAADDQQVAVRLYRAAAGYPRLREAFTVTRAAQARINQAARHEPTYREAEQRTDVERAQMVLEVLANLRQYEQRPFYAYLRRRRAESWTGQQQWLP